ncbi:MAG TPA: universal stress protein [Methylomirabilota bacterium]|nr:universal stress protein [Methylomirabilota bacterium]
MSGVEVRTIVFPTDFSDCSRHAGVRAADLARRFGAHLHVLHVDPPVTTPTGAARLGSAVAALGDDLDVTTATTAGIPARAICAYARRVGADLIVMGTHGRTGISRALLGSVAEAVVRRAECPVMTIPAGEPVRPAPAEPAAEDRCVVCGDVSADLICETCRAFIRGEALEAKRGDERAGRTGAPR